MQMLTIDTSELSNADALKARVMALKSKLPKRYTEKFMQAYPKYNDSHGTTKLRNVVNLTVSDADITEKLESLFLNK